VNVVDNNTVLQIVEALKSPLSNDGRINLLNVLIPVSGFACKENADAISDQINKMEDQSHGSEFSQTNDVIHKLKAQLAKDEYSKITCEEYWKTRASLSTEDELLGGYRSKQPLTRSVW
jgi:hypothetical protein